ncbi:diacylglycerol kinase [Lapidilactobacillus gannanensis]|uniref:Diacylglycerol kinase n=1 Tax=Lapidilactobacillus gannanensis TaxID=2486002 RepID=A0ABW4BK23_9LACO|nr:diacylglycerol kinase [Lapidilactobacillus gannanensis]
MLYWLIVFVAFIILFYASNRLLAWLKGKGIKINRWIWAVASFLVIIIPKSIFPNMNNIVLGVLYVFCAVFALNFMIEQHDWFVKSKI